jgi:uncharacterized damage-inducible protein DinB
MRKLDLSPPEGYDPQNAALVGAMAAQLDLLLASLTGRVRDATVDELEWQLQPGVNTIGMLLAHLAVAEVYWIAVLDRGIASDDEADRVVQEIVGIRMDEDGLPLPENGTHPRSLAGKTAADYLAMLGRARSATHRVLRSWDDRGLAETRRVDGREVSRAWMLHHAVEHFSYHLGQIAQLASLRRRLQCG